VSDAAKNNKKNIARRNDMPAADGGVSMVHCSHLVNASKAAQVTALLPFCSLLVASEFNFQHEVSYWCSVAHGRC